MGYERLSPQDTTFLHIEDDHQPMHVGSLGYLEAAALYDEDGRFRLDEVRRRIGGRLHLVPRFRKRIQWVPLEQGRPVWVDDEHFDLAYHVRLTALPHPGDEEQVKVLMARLQAQPLDRRRPLWELWFVEGVEGDRVALIQKTHHSMIDGVSGVDVATVLLDLEPEPPEVEPPGWRPEPPPQPVQLLVDSIVERVVEPAEALRSVRAALRTPRQAAQRLVDVAKAAGDLGTIAPSTPFNVPITPHRRFELARVSLDQVRAIKNREGTTVNDVVLAACTSALRAFLIHRAEPVDELVLRALVPVSVRDDTQKMALGNRVSMMAADLPVGESDPRSRLASIHQSMSALKESGQAVAAEALMNIVGFAPPTLFALAARLAVRTRAVNLTITNVPGPQFPLYCMGARVLEAFPYVGVLDNMALVIGVVSYDGQLGFGISADRSALPDLEVVAAGIEAGFAELDVVPPAASKRSRSRATAQETTT